MNATLNIEGMRCKSCEMLLTDVIAEITGAQKVSADSKKGTVTITAADPGTIEEAKKAIVKEGYKVVG